jgi:low affinity Fe/Cu permease
MSTAPNSRKGSASSPAAKNGKSAPAAKNNNGAQANGNQSADKFPKPGNKTPSWFTVFAQKAALLAGRPIAFLFAVITIVVWAMTGPIFGYSDTWQLVINTGTTIVTFLMVFLIQNSQNRDAMAFQVKLDELIIKLHGAGNEIAGAEDLCDEDLEALHEAYKKRAAHAHETLEKRRAAR